MAGKAFTRYHRDPAFREAVDAEFAAADAATVPASWITYAIHDPSRPDVIGGETAGLIIYVGQSKEFGKRVRKRMRDAGTAVRRPTDRIDGACYDIMENGRAPRFTVREVTGSAVASLVSETNVAKAMLAKGYPLLNRWTEQRFGGLEIDRHTLPHDWLWPMTASDAVGSKVDVIVRDMASGQELVLDLGDFPPKMRLRDIKALVRNSGARSVRLMVR